MKKITLICVLLLSSAYCFGQEQENSSFSLTMVSDTFFGFAPLVTGDYSINNKTSFTYYGIYWSGGTGLNWGNWAEFGAGVNFQLSESVNFNPQLGIVHGNLLSSFTAGPSVFGDGLVPNLILGLDNEQVEGEIYFGYYLPLRSEGETTSSFIHYWASLGYKLSDFVSAGAHYEHLYGGPENAEEDYYQWIGPYVQLNDPKGRGFIRLSGGLGLVDSDGFEQWNNSFYKLAFGINF